MKKYYIFLLITGLFATSAFSQSPDILLNGTVSAENNQIKNVADPTDPADAVNKYYLLQVLDTTNIYGNLQNVLNAGPNANLTLDSNNNQGVELIFSVDGDNHMIYKGFTSTIDVANGQAYAIFADASAPNQDRNHAIQGSASGGEELNVGLIGLSSGSGVETTNMGVWGQARYSPGSNIGVTGYAHFESGQNYGIYGSAMNSSNLNIGVAAETSANISHNGDNYALRASAMSESDSGVNYGVYSVASGGSESYAGFFIGDVKVSDGKIDSDVTLVNPPTEDMDAVNKGYLMELLASYQSQIDNLQAQINATNNGLIPSNVPLDGLYAYYPFNGDADDAIGDNFGTVMGNASLTSDRFGTDNKAYSFDGSDDYISLHEPWFDGNPSVSAFTYSTWIYVDGYPNQQSSINTKEGYWRTVGIQLGTSGQIVFGGSQPSPNAYHDWSTSSGAITVGQWNHIAVTFTNSNLRIYINGQLSVDETASISNWTFTWSDQGNSTNTNLIGAVAPASGVTKFFNGKIDDFAMWSRALTANEVAELYDL
tara:strand:- start:1727 stop:3346 length:1620 start_codon:yes stop_codon:yes gene_type:complete